jgi:hypothetical protein
MVDVAALPYAPIIWIADCSVIFRKIRRPASLLKGAVFTIHIAGKNYVL